HLDETDMLEGWRVITALGNYDSRFGGDLVMWDEKKILRFPPGSSFLVPAARMRYSFTAVGEGETHFLMSQHMHAGLHRFVVNGFAHEGGKKKEDSAATAARLASLHSTTSESDQQFE
ncbi:hypothetical protein C8R43DRAFT_910584, partial [Mycena crocata]